MLSLRVRRATAATAAFFAAVVFVAFVSASAAPDDADPAQPIRALAAALESSTGGADTTEALSTALRDNMDFEVAVPYVLGAHAAAASDAQRGRLTGLLADWIAASLQRRLRVGAPGSLTVTATRPIRDMEWLVSSRVAGIDSREFVLIWRVRTREGLTRVIDVMRDGVSAMTTLRNELAIALQRDGIDAVLDEMQRRNAEN